MAASPAAWPSSPQLEAEVPGFMCISVLSTSCELKWNTPVYEDSVAGFEIAYREDGYDGAWTCVRVPPTSYCYCISNLTPATQYRFRIRADYGNDIYGLYSHPPLKVGKYTHAHTYTRTHIHTHTHIYALTHSRTVLSLSVYFPLSLHLSIILLPPPSSLYCQHTHSNSICSSTIPFLSPTHSHSIPYGLDRDRVQSPSPST